MEVAESLTLGAAIVWVIWQPFSLRKAVINDQRIGLPIVPSLPIFAVFILAVSILHLSALHLIWMWGLSLVLGTIALLLIPPVYNLSMDFLALLTMDELLADGLEEDDEEDWEEDDEYLSFSKYLKRSKLIVMQPLFKGVKRDKPRGFG
jgi:hypothetical protein